MARTNGAYTRPTNSFSNPVTGTIISATDADLLFDDIETALDTISILDTKFSIRDNSDPTKLVAFQVSGVTTGTTRTLTVPDANTTLVGTDATQTLTNKTLTAPTMTTPVLGVATATSINGLTISATTGTLTLTNGKTLAVSNTLTFTGTDSSSVAFGAGGTVVYDATTQTLTNKTISGASNTLTNIGGTSIRMGSDAQGDVLYFNGTNYVRLAAGTSGYFLKTQGAGANPAWDAASGTATAATQAEEEAASSTTVFTTPGRQKFHPGMAKGWGKADAAGTVNASYNLTSVTDAGVGLITWTWDTDFSSADYSVSAGGLSAGGFRVSVVEAQAAGSTQIQVYNNTPAAADPTSHYIQAFGDFA